MLSSLSAFGGLSSAELLTLFGANSPSSATSSSATSTSAAQSMSSGDSTADASDPIKAIKSILAGAQMEQRLAAPSTGESTSIAGVAAAYAEQQVGSGGYALSFSGANDSAAWSGSEQSFAGEIQGETPGGASAVNISGVSFQASSFYNGGGVSSDAVSFNNSVVAASISAVSASEAANGAATGLAAAQTDVFYLSDSLGTQSASVGFEVGGLGEPVAVPSLDWTSGGAVVSVGQGDVMESFTISSENGDSAQTTSLTIGGLNMAQAQQLEASFENAVPTYSGHDAFSETDVSADANSARFGTSVSYFSGASVAFIAQISSGWTPSAYEA